MRIAQIAPLIESVPPKYYGGTERIVSYLTEALVDLGHDVTLYASGDSKTSAKLKAICPKALRLDPTRDNPLPDTLRLGERAVKDSDNYDVMHFHLDYLGLPFIKRIQTPTVSTPHWRFDTKDIQQLYKEFQDIPLVSVSNAQRLIKANWIGTVYHGLPKDLLKLNEKPKKYVAFLGRISPEKKVDDAIRIAIKSNAKLKIAAKIDKKDKEYFETHIEKMLNHKNVEFIGEIGETEKQEFLGNAQALLFPIDWPEPFGIVMIEAMACGTPVIARPRGSVREVINAGRSGLFMENINDGVKVLKNIGKIKRAHCRAMFEKRFTSERMAKDYVEMYKKIKVQLGK